MRHRKKTKKLGRKTAHRKALLSNMAISLIKHKSIQTTTVKAKVLRSYIEKLITMAKKDTIAARREVYSKVHSRDIVKILFDEVAPKFADKEGGYTRITKIGFRKGDGAETALIELLLEKEEKKPKKTEKKSAKKTTIEKVEKKAVKKETEESKKPKAEKEEIAVEKEVKKEKDEDVKKNTAKEPEEKEESTEEKVEEQKKEKSSKDKKEKEDKEEK
ncbi:50S ribosomal protein L17 [candidate division TA06 bacterium]|uniref:Large ribosomal subunit protein bL17 n=1 Tax=candidate division TA06 bacterium TaxID=2250710 RepID=A0A660S668_UNCT6|nr:MAG: 50S ribosomal protein L17 [candidate division TA06 bacterium]